MTVDFKDEDENQRSSLIRYNLISSKNKITIRNGLNLDYDYENFQHPGPRSYSGENLGNNKCKNLFFYF